jgi:hypothetical protein
MNQINPNIDSAINKTSTSSTWKQETQMDFKNGTGENVTIKSSGKIKLNLHTNYIEDNFSDGSKIQYKSNVVINTERDQVELNKIYKTFGGFDNDYGRWVEQTSDGGYIILGEEQSFGSGGGDIWLIKTDSSLNMQWNKTFGGMNYDMGGVVKQTSDLGYIILGETESYGAGKDDIWLVKTDNLGNKKWDKTFGGSENDYCASIHETSDLGFIVLGSTYDGDDYDVWLIKTDSSGNLEWQNLFGTNKTDRGYFCQQTSDKGYVIIGETDSSGSGNRDIWLIKTDSSGEMEWNKTYGGSEIECGNYVLQTQDGGYFVVGHIGLIGNPEVWLIKTDNNGNMEWNRTIGGSNTDNCFTALEASDGGYVLAGATWSYGAGSSDIWLIKIDEYGNIKQSHTIGWSGMDVSFSIIQSSDGSYLLAGITAPEPSYVADILIIKIQPDYLLTGKNLGSIESNDLLNSRDIFSLNKIYYNTSISSKTEIKIQFSKDNLNWYNSKGLINGWNKLYDDSHSIDLTDLGWQGPNFYYRANFSSDNMEVPILQHINISYSKYESNGTFESEAFYSDGKVNWRTLDWNSNKPEGTDIKFQLRFADTFLNLSSKIYIGPDGTTFSHYTTSNEEIKFTDENDQWVQYKLFLSTSVGSKTPMVNKTNIIFNYLPTAPILTEPSSIEWINDSKPIFSWILNDKDSSSQGGFQWQLDDTDDFSSVVYDSGNIFSNLTSYIHPDSISDGTWYWRVRTQDRDGDWGPFSDNGVIKIDTKIGSPLELMVTPENYSSVNSFSIDWKNPEDFSGIETGAYYYIGYNPPINQENGTWVSKKPFIVSASKQGQSNIYIWLKDIAGNSNFTKYSIGYLKLDEDPPKIEHNEVIKVNEGNPITVFTDIYDDESGVDEVKLFFKRFKDQQYTELLMEYNGNNYSAIISKDNVKPEGLEYFIKVSDRSNPNNLIFYGNAGVSKVKPNPETDIDIQVIRKKIKQQESVSIWSTIIGGFVVILLIIIIFIITLRRGKKKQLSLQPQKAQMQLSIQPQLPQRQPSDQPPVKNCSICGQALKFYQQNDRYYCHLCQKYE